ncbi:MAG: helix-turn-helix domain-containing protein [Planctomycetes bacterium]|nr:helix-turn-helix domain-containing protein [Planctomycetota bacterium]NUQ33988.1 helix-turn-helix transcriptional regulator [Planctomycetaceae bacterium]
MAVTKKAHPSVKIANVSARAVKYFELVGRFPLMPIESDKKLRAAYVVLDELHLKPRLDAGEKAYLAVLGKLVGEYEKERFQFDDVSEADILETLIEAKGVSQADVARCLGVSEPTISSIVNGTRSLGKKHIVALADYFGVSPAVFLPKAAS